MDKHQKRIRDIERLVCILKLMKQNKKPILYGELVLETMRVFSICRSTAIEYINMAVNKAGLEEEEILGIWYGKKFEKTSLNEAQRTL